MNEGAGANDGAGANKREGANGDEGSNAADPPPSDECTRPGEDAEPDEGAAPGVGAPLNLLVPEGEDLLSAFPSFVACAATGRANNANSIVIAGRFWDTTFPRRKTGCRTLPYQQRETSNVSIHAATLKRPR